MSNTAKIYVRLSRDEEGQTSTEDQERECRKLADRLGIANVKVYLEQPGTSGFKDVARPVFDDLLANLSSTDVVVVWALDRLTRRGMEQAGAILRILEERGARLVTVSDGIDTAQQEGTDINVGIRAIMAREYSKGISRNVKRGKATGAAAGGWNGGQRWYGYAVDAGGVWRGPTAINQDEADVLHEMRRRYVQGERFLNIVADLNKRGIPTAQGQQWRSENALRLIMNKRYAGVRTHNGTEYPASWPAIFTEHEYAEIVARKHEAERMKAWPTGPTGARSYLLTGFAVCECGGPMVGNRHRKQRRYKCRGVDNRGVRISCGTVYRSADPLELLVSEAVLFRLDTPELGTMLAQPDGEDHQVSLLAADYDAKKRNTDNVVDAFAQGLMTPAQFATAKRTAQAAQDAAEQALNRAMTKNLRLHFKTGQTLREAWKAGDLDWRRQFIGLIVKQVIIRRSPPGGTGSWRGYRFRPQDVEIVWVA